LIGVDAGQSWRATSSRRQTCAWLHYSPTFMLSSIPIAYEIWCNSVSISTKFRSRSGQLLQHVSYVQQWSESTILYRHKGSTSRLNRLSRHAFKICSLSARASLIHVDLMRNGSERMKLARKTILLLSMSSYFVKCVTPTIWPRYSRVQVLWLFHPLTPALQHFSPQPRSKGDHTAEHCSSKVDC
jgi:hypothetical protein